MVGDTIATEPVERTAEVWSSQREWLWSCHVHRDLSKGENEPLLGLHTLDRGRLVVATSNVISVYLSITLYTTVRPFCGPGLLWDWNQVTYKGQNMCRCNLLLNRDYCVWRLWPLLLHGMLGERHCIQRVPTTASGSTQASSPTWLLSSFLPQIRGQTLDAKPWGGFRERSNFSLPPWPDFALWVLPRAECELWVEHGPCALQPREGLMSQTYPRPETCRSPEQARQVENAQAQTVTGWWATVETHGEKILCFWLRTIICMAGFGPGRMPGCPHNKHPLVLSVSTPVAHRMETPRPKIGSAAVHANLAQSWGRAVFGNACASTHPTCCPHSEPWDLRTSVLFPFS